MAVGSGGSGIASRAARLAEVYADEADISGSHTIACGWFLLAAKRLRGIHLHRARSGYERIASHLSPGQIDQARRFVRDWAAKPAETSGASTAIAKH